MKAVLFHRYGGSEVLQYEDVPRPTPGPGQVLLKVAATSFNPVDAGIRGGYLTDVFPITFPHIPGIDVAGTIAEFGDGVQGWNVGDPVVALLPMESDGAAAEYVLAPAEVLAAAPRSVSLADAAALPVAGLTAWQALFEVAGVTAGQTILINGASGAVGGYAVQLAKQAGAVVTATSKPRDADRLRGYGADRLIGYLDYGHSPIVVDGAPFDVVLNLVSTSPQQTDALISVIADGGFHVGTMTSGPEDPGRQVRTQRVFVRSDAEQLAGLVSRVDAGQLRIGVADRRPLVQAAAVHAVADAGRLPGKTILVPDER
ncbi:NADPH:quinone reductase [Mycobacterium kubicae]|uniref:NADP-dependent oxidoreductase n=1 Tax=Mycobacterium kubicae TaxID=120959 RepID=A0AAX1JG19_9MYCO|nr:NADP-dependent oxidoreductase [Mycobacterium kubicae]MCV7093920.1 NADP-dependent oxidoreductase [Mycobacterium kubicae]ORV96056.1 NADPH:quinone reductase [Mycobacterium kubicae]QNI11947.1 NADP-dependent oxidoreductase [Mycobacterium kubicae]QPI40172.1 NADP-dependent oxidoreductase [Mycobacterium kubicae]GFG64885.1 NADPH:quinone reductase [Mycobacterium kubicae]